MRFIAFFLTTCVSVLFSAAHAAAPDVQQISDRLLELDIGVSDVKTVPRNAGSSVPNSYEAHLEFTIASVAPRGGQLFTCTQARYCEAIYEYFYALRSLAGPYIFQSRDGLIVAQLNSGLSVKEAEAVEAVLLEFK